MPVARPIEASPSSGTKQIGFMLYLFLIPPLLSILLALFSLQIKAFFFNFIAFLLFYGALYFSKKGFAAEFAYNHSHFAKAPRPYKLFAALTLSAATWYSAYLLAHFSLFESLFLAAIAFVGYILWYGLDPRGDKVPAMGDMGAEVAYATLQRAKERVSESMELARSVTNPTLQKELLAALQKAQSILLELEQRPTYVRTLRKFLVVYVDSLWDVTKSYANHQEGIDPKIEEELRLLLQKVQERFVQELERLREDATRQLDTKIEVFERILKE